MRRLTSLVSLLLLMLAVVPALSCVTSEVMSHDESACCVAMHGHCGAMSKQGCCTTVLRTDEHPQLARTAADSHLYWVVVALLARAPHSARVMAFLSEQAGLEDAPPGLRLSVSSPVLRI